MNYEKFKHGWATGSMRCRKCQRIFAGVRFRYSCHDKVDGVWPFCCGENTTFCNDWIEEPKPNENHNSRKSARNQSKPEEQNHTAGAHVWIETESEVIITQ